MTVEITDEMVDTVGQEVYGDTWEPRHDHIGTWQAHNVHAALTAALPIIEKQVREQQASAWSEGFKAGRNADHNPMWWPKNPYRIVREEE